MQVTYYIAETVGIELIKSAQSDIQYPLHNHVSVFTVGMVLQGNVSLILVGQQFSLSANDAYVAPPYVAHSLTASRPYSLLSLCIDRRLFDAPKKDFPFDAAALLLAQAFEGGGIDAYQLPLFRDFLKRLRTHESRIPEQDGPVARLCDMIVHRPEQPLSGSEMADMVALGRFHLIHKFKSEVGLAPHQFQIQNRVRKAQRLLHKPLSLADIAIHAGFCDQSHLTRCFEKIVGLSPATYRQSVVELQNK